MKVLITEAVTGPEIDRLGDAFTLVYQPELYKDRTTLYREIGDADALIVRNQTQVDAALLERAPHLMIVARAGAGLDNVDIEAAEAAGVVVSSTPEENANSVAELVFTLMLGLARKLVTVDRATKAGGWDRRGGTGIELYGRTLGLVGLGRIGFRVAVRARAFGMQVLAHDPMVSSHSLQVAESGSRLVSLDTLLTESDVVSLHVPLLPTTRGMINAERLAAVKPGALLINAARGELVDEDALVDALKSGRLGGAGLDVRAQEPPQVGELERMDNVILTPHVGALTEEAQARVSASVAADVRRVLSGEAARQSVGISTPRRAVAGTIRS